MKKTIEIECPNGYKPVYNAETGKVEIVPSSSTERIKSFTDATNEMGVCLATYMRENQSIESLSRLQLIIDALNEGRKFNLLTGTVWYPWVRFFRMKSVPKDAEVIGHFRYQGEKFALVGGDAAYGGNAGLCYFGSYNGVGDAFSNVGLLACKSEEIAKYVSTQFGKLVFEACFARHFNVREFEWLD